MTRAATTEARTSLRGVVETVFYSGPTFTAGRLRTPDGALVNFAGKVFAKPSDPVRFEGQWMNHPKYGRQFSVESLGYDLEMDADGLANFLASHPDVKGIGPAKARLIADEFGAGFDAAIRARPEAVAAVAKAPLESILALQRIWIANSDFNAAMSYLSGFGLTHYQVTTLVDRFGSQVVPLLERDPYVLMREIPGFGFSVWIRSRGRWARPRTCRRASAPAFTIACWWRSMTATAGSSTRICWIAPTHCW